MNTILIIIVLFLLLGVLFYFSTRHLMQILNEKSNKEKYLKQITRILNQRKKRIVFHKYLNLSNEKKSPLYNGKYGFISGFFGSASKKFYLLIVCENYGEKSLYEKYWSRVEQSAFTKTRIELSDPELINEKELEVIRLNM